MDNTLTKEIKANNQKINDLLSIKQYEQRSAEWFEQRKDKLTSSDAASVLGINPYDKYNNVLFKKCGIKSEFVGNIATRHGQKYEDVAIDKYCACLGKKNYNFGLINYTDVHSDNKYYWLAGSPDGIVEDIHDTDREPILLEVKCPFRRKIINNYIPEYYLPQVQLNLFITNLKVADYIEFSPPNKLNVKRIYRDDNWLQKNLPLLENFWKDVEHYRKIGIENHPEFCITVKKDVEISEDNNIKFNKYSIVDSV